jgi:hypothetical protein
MRVISAEMPRSCGTVCLPLLSLYSVANRSILAAPNTAEDASNAANQCLAQDPTGGVFTPSGTASSINTASATRSSSGTASGTPSSGSSGSTSGAIPVLGRENWAVGIVVGLMVGGMGALI